MIDMGKRRKANIERVDRVIRAAALAVAMGWGIGVVVLVGGAVMLWLHWPL